MLKSFKITSPCIVQYQYTTPLSGTIKTNRLYDNFFFTHIVIFCSRRTVARIISNTDFTYWLDELARLHHETTKDWNSWQQKRITTNDWNSWQQKRITTNDWNSWQQKRITDK